MNFNSEYKKQIDKHFDENVDISSDEMFRRAQNSSVAEREITMTTKNKRNIIVRTIAAAAACVVISGTTAYALSSGKLSDFFRKSLKDDVTANIIDEGYLFEIDQQIKDDRFTVNFLGVTGDWMNPKFIIDVEITDSEAAAEAQGIRLTTYILEKGEYEEHIDRYATFEAYGVKDESNPDLYHVCIDAPSSQVVNGQEAIMDILSIGLINDGNVTECETDMKFEFSFPLEAVKDVTTKSYDGLIEYEKDGAVIKFESGYFSDYSTELTVAIDISGTDIIEKYSESLEQDAQVQQLWDEVRENTFIVVDGRKYENRGKTYSYCDDSLIERDPTKYRVPLFFPPFDHLNAKEMKLVVYDKEYDLSEEAYWGYGSDGIKTFYVVKDGVETVVREEPMTPEEYQHFYGGEIKPAEETVPETEPTSEAETDETSAEETTETENVPAETETTAAKTEETTTNSDE